jgi:hypothetical protein
MGSGTNLNLDQPSRLLGDDGNASEGGYLIGGSAVPAASVNLVSVSKTLSEGMVQTWASAADLNLAKIEHGWWVLLTVGCLIGAVVGALFVAHRADSKARSVPPMKTHLTKAAVAIQSRKITTIIPGSGSGKERAMSFRVAAKNKPKARRLPINNIDVEASLPEIMRTKSFLERFTTEMKRYHRWFGIVFYFSDDFSRVLRIVSLVGNIVSMLFVQAVTYAMTNPDTGQCAEKKAGVGRGPPWALFA